MEVCESFHWEKRAIEVHVWSRFREKGAIHRELYTRPSLNIDTLPDRSTDLWLQSDSLLVAFEILLWIATFFSPFHVFPLYFSPLCILFVHPDDNFSGEKNRHLGCTTREIYGKHGEVANNVSKHIVILYGILRYICCIICMSPYVYYIFVEKLHIDRLNVVNIFL